MTVLFGDDLNRNLEALRHLGLLVVLRRHARRRQNLDLAFVLERGERHVEAERAVDRAERQAERRRRAGHGEVDGRAAVLELGRARIVRTLRHRSLCCTRPPSVPRFGNAEAGRVAELRRDAAVEAPLHAERARRVAVGLENLRLDLDLRLGPVELGDELTDLVELLRRGP